MEVQDEIFVIDESGGGDLVIVEDTPASPVVDTSGGGDLVIVEDTPASPVIDTSGGGDLVIVEDTPASPVVDTSGGGDLVIVEDTPASPVPDESPESPPPEGEGQIDYLRTVTRVRIERPVSEDDDDVIIEGVGFAIDCVGQSDEGHEQRQNSNQKRGGKHFPPAPAPQFKNNSTADEVEVVGAVSSQPCCSSSLRNQGGILRPDKNYFTRNKTTYSQEYQDDVFPIYEVEPDIIITGVSSLNSKPKEAPETAVKQPARPKPCCFNCGEEGHRLPSCPKKADAAAISNNRKKFMASKNNNNNYSSNPFGPNNYKNNPFGPNNNRYENKKLYNRRYHEEMPESSSPYENFKPGVLSDELREVMGVNPWQLPLHIYRMRIFGYPPGWLEHATEESSSGLKLYGKDTISMQLGAPKRESRVNADLIFAYPGFNAPIPQGVQDESREMGFPRYTQSDSIENMLRKINQIRKESLEIQENKEKEAFRERPQSWEFNSLDRIDQPTTNSGKWYGVGRGRYQEPPKRTRPVGEAIQPELVGVPAFVGYPGPHMLLGPRDKVFRKRVDPVDVPKVDERYLTRPCKTKVNRKRQGRTSPSLLGGMNQGVNEETVDLDKNMSSPESPVIVNLPPTPASPVRNKGTQMMECDDSDDATGSSGDYVSSPKPKRRKISDDDDNDVMIINEDEGSKVNKSDSDEDDCIVITSINTVVCAQAAKSNKTKDVTKRATTDTSSPSKKVPDVVQLDSPENDGDWEQEETFAPVSKNVRPASPDSSTGDEATILGTGSAGGPKKKKKKKRNGSEDWEESSEEEEQLADDSNSCQSIQETSLPKKPKEFVPCNAQLEAIKDVLLANVEEEESAMDTNSSFSALPSYEKFAQGMPEMTFEEEPPERTGRLDRVLKAIKSRRSGGENSNSSQ